MMHSARLFPRHFDFLLPDGTCHCSSPGSERKSIWRRTASVPRRAPTSTFQLSDFRVLGHNRVSLSFRGIAVITRTIRSRFDHEVGGTVESCTILEKSTVIPPDLAARRRGVYEYLLEVPPTPIKLASPPKTTKSPSPRKVAPEPGSFTRSTPDERGVVVRRLPSR